MKLSFLPPEHQEKIDKLDINKLDTDSLDRETTGYIIWKIREKLFDISLNNGVNINDTQIKKAILIIKLAIPDFEENYENINELINRIYWLNFNDIWDFFLSNELQKIDFIKQVKEFLNSNDKKFSDKIIEKRD